MASKTRFGEIGGREWLTYSHNEKEGAFAFPPIQGTHRDCYQKMKADSEVVPAEGLYLAILTEGAYTENTPRWQKVKADCFVRWTRAPVRTLWVPHGNDLAGVLLERDLEGLGRTTDMKLPKNIDGWKKGDNGIYQSQDKNLTFVPEGSYKIGEHNKNSFAKDGFATAVLTAEGAEVFARTASNTKFKPYTWGFEAKNISDLVQRVVVLGVYDDRLGLVGNYGWDDNISGYAFGVRSSGEANA